MSSLFYWVTLDGTKLTAVFNSNTETVYEYKLSPEIADMWKTAIEKEYSLGKFFNKNIRPFHNPTKTDIRDYEKAQHFMRTKRLFS